MLQKYFKLSFDPLASGFVVDDSVIVNICSGEKKTKLKWTVSGGGYHKLLFLTVL